MNSILSIRIAIPIFLYHLAVLSADPIPDYVFIETVNDPHYLSFNVNSDEVQSIWSFHPDNGSFAEITNVPRCSSISTYSPYLDSDRCFSQIPDNQYFLTLRRNEGESIGSKTCYTTVEAFSFPCHYQNIRPFLDFRAHYFDTLDDYAGNIGLGLRIESKDIGQIFGVNAYYDHRRTHHASFNQVGLGLEILGRCWNFRLNGYLPIGKTSVLDSCCFYNKYIGDFFYLQKSFTSSLRGIDFEIESLVAEMCWGEIYLAIGSYYYNGKGCQKNVYGSEYRVSTDFCKYFNFSIISTYDNVFKTRVQAQLSVTIPFFFAEEKKGGSGRFENDARVFKPVQREEIIILKKRKQFIWNF